MYAKMHESRYIEVKNLHKRITLARRGDGRISRLHQLPRVKITPSKQLEPAKKQWTVLRITTNSIQ